ncbi:glucose 1-dehydrogenase [Kitasatospora putterlickiae]|uniref:Glucose 1-dehydrogenase n=1 Tax=Kitasatospora putterlickiae TaxID=221725 RepID=A0ABN1Y4G1_9ACTN
MVNSFSLAGRVALVTGASRGIGRAVALGLAAAGARTVLTARSGKDLASLAAEIAGRGGEALVLEADIAAEGAAGRVVADAAAWAGRLDVVVNNAGAIAAAGPFLELTREDWRDTLGLNFHATAEVCRAAGPVMLAQGSGSVVNMASVAGTNGVPMISHYAVSKAAMISLTRTLATEWAAGGVRVNALAPGWVTTDLTGPFAAVEGLADSLVHSVPARRWGAVEDVTGPALFLASDASRFVTGHVLVVDGGLSAYEGGPGLLDLVPAGRIGLA